MKRKRAHIPLIEQLAAALACLLPADVRDDLRARRVQAKVVRSMFEVDHIVLHAHGGTDRWHNLDPKLKAVHREKSKRDTGIVAKGKRIDDKWFTFMTAMRKGHKPPMRKGKSRWPSRPMRSRRAP